MPVEIEEGLSVVIYTRYSTDKQDTSTERQIEQVQKKIIQYGLIEVGRYSDEGLSGTHVLRPSYEQMKADIASGKIEPDILLCASVDRLTREDVMEANAELNHFKRCRVNTFLFYDGAKEDSYNLLEQRDLFMLSFKLYEGHAYVESLAEKSSSGSQRLLASKSGGIPSRPPFGWMLDVKKEKRSGSQLSKVVEWQYVPHPEEAPVVVELFKMVISGKSSGQCVAFLGEQEIYRQSYKFDKTEVKRAHPRTGSVKAILRNVVHCGGYSYGVDNRKTKHLTYSKSSGGMRNVDELKSRRKQNANVLKMPDIHLDLEHHKGIISFEDFERVQEILDGNSKPAAVGGKYTYSRKLRCHHCGSRLVAEVPRKKDKNGVYKPIRYKNGKREVKVVYSCPKSRHSYNPCTPSKQISERNMDDLLAQLIHEQMVKPEFWYDYFGVHKAEMNDWLKQLGKPQKNQLELSRLKKELVLVEGEIRVYREEQMPVDEFFTEAVRKRKSILEEIDRINEAINEDDLSVKARNVAQMIEKVEKKNNVKLQELWLAAFQPISDEDYWKDGSFGMLRELLGGLGGYLIGMSHSEEELKKLCVFISRWIEGIPELDVEDMRERGFDVAEWLESAELSWKHEPFYERTHPITGKTTTMMKGRIDDVSILFRIGDKKDVVVGSKDFGTIPHYMLSRIPFKLNAAS